MLDKSFSLTRAEQAQEWGAAPPPDREKPVDPNTPKCTVCGRALMASHNENRCLRGEVVRLSALIVQKETEIATLKRLDRDGRGPCSNNSLELTGSTKPVEPEPEKT